jgi:hypothetical protein
MRWRSTGLILTHAAIQEEQSTIRGRPIFMMTGQQRVLQLAILGLETQRAQIEQELAEIRAQLTRTSHVQPMATASSGRSTGRSRTAPNKGKPMSAAQKRKISAALKARWAQRKKA